MEGGRFLGLSQRFHRMNDSWQRHCSQNRSVITRRRSVAESSAICMTFVGSGRLDRMTIGDARQQEFNEGGPDVIKGFLIISRVTGLVGKAIN